MHISANCSRRKALPREAPAGRGHAPAASTSEAATPAKTNPVAGPDSARVARRPAAPLPSRTQAHASQSRMHVAAAQQVTRPRRDVSRAPKSFYVCFFKYLYRVVRRRRHPKKLQARAPLTRWHGWLQSSPAPCKQHRAQKARPCVPPRPDRTAPLRQPDGANAGPALASIATRAGLAAALHARAGNAQERTCTQQHRQAAMPRRRHVYTKGNPQEAATDASCRQAVRGKNDSAGDAGWTHTMSGAWRRAHAEVHVECDSLCAQASAHTLQRPQGRRSLW